MLETWKSVRGFEGYLGADQLEVSDFGNIRNYNTKALVEQKPDSKGYLRVLFCKGGHSESVHRLVLFAFVGPPESRRYICCHWDGNTSNNKLSNLRWGTNADNGDDRRRHNLEQGKPAKVYVRKKATKLPKKTKHAHFDAWLVDHLVRKAKAQEPVTAAPSEA